MSSSLTGSNMLPNQHLVQHQHPNYNYPSVLTQSQAPPATSLHGQHSSSQYPTHVQYSLADQTDHSYAKVGMPSPSSQLVPSSVPSIVYPQHGGSPVHQSASPFHYGYPPSVQHGSPQVSHPSLQYGSSASPVSPQSVSSEHHGVNHQLVQYSMTPPTSSQFSNITSFPSQLPYNTTNMCSQNLPVSSSNSEGESGFTKVTYNRKSRSRAHSISSSGSNDTVTSRSSKRIRGNNKAAKKPNFNIQVSNKFSPLNQEASNIPQDDNADDTAEPIVKIPPIFISKKSITVGELLKSLKALNPDFSLKDSKESLRLECGSIEAYRAFSSLLNGKNIEYHSYRLPQDRTIDVVMKHVPTDFTDTEVADELKALGFSNFKLMRVWGKNKEPIPIVSLYLDSNIPKNKDIYAVDKLLNCVVFVEPKRRSRNNIPQCINCQRFGHTKNYCKLAPRCMFCGDNHLSANCDKMQEENTVKVCANCGENHSANYRGCKYYADLKKRRFRYMPERLPAAPHHSNSPPDISGFPSFPHSKPSSSRPANLVGDHSYAGAVGLSTSTSHNMPPFSTPQFHSSPLPTSSNAGNSIPNLDILAETVMSALKPLFVALLDKIKPMIQDVLMQILNGSR